MKFGDDHKVDIDTMTAMQVPPYLEFLEHEWERHRHETDNAQAMIDELATASCFWSSAKARHREAQDACGDLIDSVRVKLARGYWEQP